LSYYLLKDINLFLKTKCDIIKGALSIVFIGGKDIEKEKCFLSNIASLLVDHAVISMDDFRGVYANWIIFTIIIINICSSNMYPA